MRAATLAIQRSRNSDHGVRDVASPPPSTFRPSTFNLFKYNPRAPFRRSGLHIGGPHQFGG
jgi:hypothetical protein